MNNLFVKSNNVVQKTILNWRMSARNASRRDSTIGTSKDYRNIIERLQVNADSRGADAVRCSRYLRVVSDQEKSPIKAPGNLKSGIIFESG